MLIRRLAVKGLIKMRRLVSEPVNDAITPANKDSFYTFSTQPNTTIGTVPVVKKTAKDPNGLTWISPTHDETTDIMTFDGRQSLSYTIPNNTIHIAPLPFSLQIDIQTTQTTGHQYIVNLGQGYGLGYPEWILELNGASLGTNYSTANTGTSNTAYNIMDIQPNRWYRVGVMFYENAGQNHLRVYVDGVVKLEKVVTGVPWKSTAGIAFGSDNANYPDNFFKGQMRNVAIDKKLFWPV